MYVASHTLPKQSLDQHSNTWQKSVKQANKHTRSQTQNSDTKNLVGIAGTGATNCHCRYPRQTQKRNNVIELKTATTKYWNKVFISFRGSFNFLFSNLTETSASPASSISYRLVQLSKRYLHKVPKIIFNSKHELMSTRMALLSNYRFSFMAFSLHWFRIAHFPSRSRFGRRVLSKVFSARRRYDNGPRPPYIHWHVCAAIRKWSSGWLF